MGYFLTLISAAAYYLSFKPSTYGLAAFIAVAPFFFAVYKSGSVLKSIIYGALWGTAVSVLFSTPLYYALVTEYDFSIMFSTLMIISTAFLLFP
jgi:hypothetical protein